MLPANINLVNCRESVPGDVSQKLWDHWGAECCWVTLRNSRAWSPPAAASRTLKQEWSEPVGQSHSRQDHKNLQDNISVFPHLMSH